jgi:hypothetical protein
MSNDNFETLMEKTAPTLTEEEQALLWQQIKTKIVPTPVVSPYSVLFHSKLMTPLAIALVVLLGTGGTVAASATAKPGDLLFPIERVVERTQLVFASEMRAAELKAAFAAERLAELRDILDEEGSLVDDNPSADDLFLASSDGTSTSTTFSAEADVFTDITVVVVEINDVKRIFTTATTTREGVVAEIATRYTLEVATIDAALDFEVEDRASRPSERGLIEVDITGEERVSHAVNVLLDQLEEIDDSNARNGILNALVRQIDRVEVRGREHTKLKVDDDEIEGRARETERVRIEDDRVEVREDGYRIRIDKDGEVKIKKDDDVRGSSDSSRSNNPSSVTADSRIEAEADVFSDVTVVEVEINDRKTVFTTTAKTRDVVVAEIAEKFGLSEALVDAALDFEIENRMSREDDSDDVDDRSARPDEDGDEDRDDNRHRSSSDDDGDDERSRDSDDGSLEDSQTDTITKAEVRVEDGWAEVKIEYSDKELEYKTTYVTRALLVADIAMRIGLLQADIDAVLDTEIKD